MIEIIDTRASRVLIGAGARARVPGELADRAIFLIATGSARSAADALAADSAVAGRFDHPVVHTPVAVTEEALSVLCDEVEVLVAVGGGSAIGLSKALSARTGLPQVVVPTTYAGSEMTPVLGETDGGTKTTRRDPALIPGTVVYDPELTVSMPAGLTLTSALNALAHSVEALWAPNATILSDAYATESAAALVDGLPAVLDDLADIDARARVQQGAWLAGMCLAHARMGLHHQLAHVLGGIYDLPHAELHAMLLAHVMRFDLPSVPKVLRRLARVMGGDPATVVADLAAAYDGPTRLRELGVPRAGLADVADRVLTAPYPNPRELERQALIELLDAAW
ncbi:MAG: maleylacetate reductase [Nocardia sp.]|nr:maleylacetate reductase [Nocardia sp.]